MKIKELITERQVTPYDRREESIDDMMEKVFTNCKEAVSSGFLEFPIWRGFKSLTQPFFYLDPSKGERMSQNTTNHYTSLMDNSPYMKGWPKRSKSFIASSGTSYAGAFGNPYMIIPFDGVDIAVCPETDLWQTPVSIPELGKKYSRGDSHRDLSDLNDWLYNTLGFSSARFEDMVTMSKTEEFAKNVAYYISPDVDPSKVIPALQKALSPQKTGFRLMSIAEYAQERPKNKEVWFSGPCYAISIDFLVANNLYDRWNGTPKF